MRTRHVPARGRRSTPGDKLGALAVWASLLALHACSRDARAVQLPTVEGNPDVYRISCGNDIAPCRAKALEVCDGTYDILESAGGAKEPPRVTSAPGPRSTGSRYQRPQWVGFLVVACVQPGASSSRSFESALAPADAPPKQDTPAPAQLCVPGATQLCLGPGACRGAQACLDDGLGYQACDCGTTPTAPASAAADAGAAAPR